MWFKANGSGKASPKGRIAPLSLRLHGIDILFLRLNNQEIPNL
jgi:hypothetical protein